MSSCPALDPAHTRPAQPLGRPAHSTEAHPLERRRQHTRPRREQMSAQSASASADSTRPIWRAPPPWGHPPSSRKFPRRSRARSSDPTGEGMALTRRRPRAERPTFRQEAHRHRPREGRQQRQGKRRRLPVPRHRRGHRLRLPRAHRSQRLRRVRRGQRGHRRRGRRQVRVQALEVLRRRRQGDRRRSVPRLRNLRALLDPLLQHLPPLLSVVAWQTNQRREAPRLVIRETRSY